MKYHAEMKLAIMAIGLPGSGKTTLLKPLTEKYGLAYISRDDIREEMLGHAIDQSRNKEVWQEANRRTAAALRNGQGVVLDSCFVEAWKRRDAIEFLRTSGAERVVALFFNTPTRVAKERNSQRKYVVGETTIDWMEQRLTETPPSLSEGFDAFYTLDGINTFEKEELGD